MTSNVILTQEQVRGWIDEVSRITQKISELTAEKEKLNSMIEAASLFMPKAAVEQNDGSQSPLFEVSETRYMAGGYEGISLIDAIELVLKASEKPLSNKEIKSRLRPTGFDMERMTTSPNYYYTATNRLVERKLITKLQGGRYIHSSKTLPGLSPAN